MKKIIIEILRLSFYISSLIFFDNNIIVTSISLLLILYSYDLKRMLIPFIILIIFVEPMSKIIIISFVLLYLLFNKIIKKRRYYSLIIFFSSLLLIGIVASILNEFTIANLYQYLLVLIFYLVANLNIKYYKNTAVIINPTILHLIISLYYLTIITIYNPNAFLYSYFILSEYLFFNNLYILLLFSYTFSLYLIIYKIINIELIYNQIYSVFPILYYFNIDYNHISFIYFIILIPLLYIPLLLNKRNNIEYHSIDKILFVLDDYSKLLNEELINIETLKKIKKERLYEISNTICNKCNRNSPCKINENKRIAFISNAITNNDNNNYLCPHYESFYLPESEIKSNSHTKNYISKLKEELEGRYHQEIFKTKEYNKLINILSFYSIDIISIKSLSISSLYLEIEIENNKLSKDYLLLIIQPIFKVPISIGLKDNILYIYKQPKCKIEFSHKILSKNGNYLSGDNYFIKRFSNEEMLFALSDGMGSGHKAYQESTHTLNLLKRIIEYNLSIETTLDLLGYISEIRCDYDSYATLDVLKLNLATMQLYLYKIGSTTTYLIRGNDIYSYENHTLPLNLDTSSSSYNIEFFHNDIILLMSDGIADFITKEKLFNISYNNTPDIIIDNIIKYIEKKEGNILKDDASIIVIKVI